MTTEQIIITVAMFVGGVIGGFLAAWYNGRNYR